MWIGYKPQLTRFFELIANASVGPLLRVADGLTTRDWL
jgi:hypothetical protein